MRSAIAWTVAIVGIAAYLPASADNVPLPAPTYVTEWQTTGDGSSLRGVACGDSGKIYVADEGNARVHVFMSDSTLLYNIPFSVNGGGPTDVAVFADTVFVSGQGLVRRFNPSATTASAEFRLARYGGDIPGRSVSWIEVDSAYIYVAVDSVGGPAPTGHLGVARISHAGVYQNFVQTYAASVPSALNAITLGLGIDGQGAMYVAIAYHDSVSSSANRGWNEFVKVYSSSGGSGDSWTFPRPLAPAMSVGIFGGLAVDLSGTIYYVGNAEEYGRLGILAEDSESATYQGAGSPYGLLTFPLGMAIDPLGYLYVADKSQTRGRIVKLRVDNDGDDLLDSWEKYGILASHYGHDGLRWMLPNSHVKTKDLYLELDRTQGTTIPSGTIDTLTSAFAAVPNTKFRLPNPSGSDGIHLHVEVDENVTDSLNWRGDFLGTYASFKGVRFGTATERAAGVQRAKRLVSRYGVVLRGMQHPPSGHAELPGNDIVVAYQGFHDGNGNVSMEDCAGIIMHELGHNLGLYHGGIENVDHKPNYHSVMNNTWALKYPKVGWGQAWRLTYNLDSLAVLNEGKLIEPNGINDPRVPPRSVIPAGVDSCTSIGGQPTFAVKWAEATGPVDWNSDRDYGDSSVVRDLTRWATIDQANNCVMDSPSPGDTLRSYLDWDKIQFAPRTNVHWSVDAHPEMVHHPAVQEMSMDDIAALRRAIQDCNENGIDDGIDIQTGVSLDADHNGIVDECDPPRLFALADTVYACPGGELDSLQFAVDFERVYIIGSGISNHMRIDSLGSGVRAWRDDGRLMAVGDTLREYLFETDDITNHLTGYFALGRLSGCGYMGFSVWHGDSLVLRDLNVQVISMDQDNHSIGSVDRFDTALLFGAASDNLCWDLDRSGTTVFLDDNEVLYAHDTHHIPRKLTVPNGGESYAAGSVIPITWQRGYGDSARVTIRLRREGSSDSVTVVADDPDDGAYNWTVPTTVPAGATYRMQVIHTAGYYKVDNKDVGWDKSDTTFTIRPRPVVDLSSSAGRNSFAIDWTEPGQGGGTADEYEIRYTINTPVISENNFNSAAILPYGVSPGGEGTAHCRDSLSAGTCKTYYFAIRTKDNGVWSLISNVASAGLLCSGSQQVFCIEEGFMAGGGGGEEGLREVGLASTRAGQSRHSHFASEENSLLPGGMTSERVDHYLLPERPIGSEGVLEMVLRQTGGREVEVWDLGLGFVDHPEGTLAVSSASGVLAGHLGDALSVVGSRVANGADLAMGAGSSHQAQAGETVEIDLGQDGDVALLLEARGDVSGANVDSIGILVQKMNTDFTWATLETIHPRREFALTAIPTNGQRQLRLVFLRGCEVRSLRRLSDITTPEIQPLLLVTALHSRLGSIENGHHADSTTLIPGDSLRLRFASDEGIVATRGYVLTVRGQYHVAHELQGTGTSELTVFSKPVFKFALAAARPNPSSGSVAFVYSLARESDVDLRVFDVAGREVRSLVKGTEVAGEREVTWDGRDSEGRRVAPGVYFYRLRAGDWHSERKLVLIQR